MAGHAFFLVPVLIAESRGAGLPHPVCWKLAFNPSSMSKVLVRATNWLGDAVMSLPALRMLRDKTEPVRRVVVRP